MRVKEENENTGLKIKIMAFGPIISWQIQRENMESVTDFIFLVPKITVDSDCSCEIKTLAPWKKRYDKFCCFCSLAKSCPSLYDPFELQH